MRNLHILAPMIFQRLKDWQELKGYTDAALATEIDCDRSVLSRAKRGLTQLKMKHQLALEEKTGIKPSEWADFYAKVESARPVTPRKAIKKKPDRAPEKRAA